MVTRRPSSCQTHADDWRRVVDCGGEHRASERSATPTEGRSVTGTIEGTVTDGEGTGLEGVTVSITDPATSELKAETTTDPDGSYSVDVANDSYDVRGDQVGYVPDVEELVTISDETRTVDLTLTALAPKAIGEYQNTTGIGVRGTVDVESGQPIGVKGSVSSASGYGLGTPDDATVGGTTDATSLLAGEVTADSFDTDALNTVDLDAATSGQVITTTSGTDLSAVDASGRTFEVKASGPAGDTWSDVQSMQTGRNKLGVTALSGEVYAIGGRSNGSNWESSVEAYDPGNDTWSTVASLGTPRREVAAAAVDGNVYAIGGQSNGTEYEDTVEKYDPVGDSWTEVASLGTPRTRPAAAAVDGDIYAVGGESVSEFREPTVERYDPGNNAWTEVTSLNVGRNQFDVAVAGGKLYAVSGLSSRLNEDPSVEAYDPVGDSWTSVASLSVGRRYHAAAGPGLVFAIGGTTGPTSRIDIVDAYDPSTDLWWRSPSLGTGRTSLGATSVNGTIYAAGGTSDRANFENRVEALSGDPYESAFTAQQDLLVAVHGDDDALVRNATTNEVRRGDEQLLVGSGDDVEWIGSADATLYGIK